MTYELNNTANEIGLVFVYGSLLSGLVNHRVISTARLVGDAVSAPEFTFVNLGAFPGMVDGGSTAVKGEVYAVDAATLEALDHLEGHPEFYVRTEIAVSIGNEVTTVNAYLLPVDRTRLYDEVPSGDWRAVAPPTPAWLQCDDVAEYKLDDDNNDDNDDNDKVDWLAAAATAAAADENELVDECDECGAEFEEFVEVEIGGTAICEDCWAEMNHTHERGSACRA